MTARGLPVLDHGSGVRRGQHFGLVECGSPQTGAVPFGEDWRRPKRILAVANEEIGEVEFCRIFHAKSRLAP